MKKIILIFWIIFSLFFVNISFAELDETFPYSDTNANSMKEILNKSELKQVRDDFVWSDIANQKSPIAYYISKVINYFLWITAFISVLTLIYGFSLTFTDKTDEGIKKWQKYVKMATIAIIVIWISWLFSMWIFNIYNHSVVE